MTSRVRSTLGRVASIVAVTVVIAPVLGAMSTAGATTSPTFTTYVVNSTTDSTDAAGTGLCATQPPTAAKPCTLRAAVAEANALSGVTISIPAGVFTLTSGALTLSKPVTIVGTESQPGPAATTIDGNAKDRVFKVAATGVTIDGLVIRNGSVIKGSPPNPGGYDLSSIAVAGDGGGILVASGGLTLKKSTLSGNAAWQGGGIDVEAPTTISQSTITANTVWLTGGVVSSSGTLMIENSTLTANVAPFGGGLWSAKPATVRASTVTANKSLGWTGGGLYRFAGTLTVSGSILAGNSANTAANCWGSPTFTGTNIVQSPTGCTPSGSVLAVDPKLGPLGDNGGPTQTQRPLTGSPAVDAYTATGSPAACVTATDQRGVARPQPTGAKCDVGAVENLALGLDVSLAASSDSIPAGTGTVPLANIPLSALIPAPPGTSATGSAAFKHSAFKHSAFKHSAFDYAAFKHSPFKHSAFKHSPFKHSAYGFETAEALLRAAGLTDPLGTIPLTDVSLDLPGGWPAFLTGTPFAGAPLNTLTFAQVVPLLDSAGITVDNVGFGSTPLGSLPEISLLLGATPLRSIPLTAALEPASDTQRLAAWCAALATPGQDPCAALNNDPNLTLLAVSLAGFSIDDAGVEQILAKDVAAADAAVFGELSVNGLVQMGASLGAIAVSALPAGYVTCAATACPTLAAASALNAVNVDTSLLDLLTDPGAAAIPQVASFTLAALLTSMLPPDFQQWQTLDIASTPLQNVASPVEPIETYTVALGVKGDRSADTNVKLTLPAGFVVVPGTFKLDGAGQPDPTPDANNLLTLALGALAPGVHTAAIGTRAGLTTGPAAANVSATATAGADTSTATSSKSVIVTEAFENGGIATCRDIDPCATANLQPNVLYLAHISSATDRDFYRFTVPATPGQKTHASIVLSNLPADDDLVLYGPATTPLRNAPQQSASPVNDTGLSLYPSGDHVSPDTVQDVPLTPPSYAPGVVQVSAQRGTIDEQIDTGTLAPGDYAVQVSGYNGVSSAQPYALRMTFVGFDTSPCAAAPTRPFGDGGPLATSTTLGANPHVLFLVPQHRLYQTYGVARVDPMIAKVQALATNVGGTILAVDNADTSAAAKFGAWDANRCSAQAANDVVREIGHQIDSARAANPAIDSIVIVGDDSMIPMARIADRTRIANESGYGDSVKSISGGSTFDNELSGSLSDGNFLTDDAYGTTAGVSVNDHELFVPDVALGRLVETPEDIKAAIAAYLDNNGLLDPTTASSALVTGADFMKDGAQGVATALSTNGVATDTSLIGDSWNASDLTGKLLPATGPAPGIVSFNGHFDQTHMLTGNGSGVVNSSVLADPANVGKLAWRLLFSMGCHAGLSVSDVSIGVQLDWPQAITGTAQGGLFAANTGYGYGDDTSVALGERLVGLYAQALDGTVDVGRALMIAKQQYAASTEVLSPYDEKVLQESVFYGLPLFNLGSTIGSGTPPTGGTTATPDVTISGTDPRTGLAVVPVDLALTLPGAGGGAHAFHRNDTAHGSYFDVNGDTIQVQYRPIEPMTRLDVTAADPTTGALTRKAHGLLITDLTSVDLGGFTPDYFLPTLDQGAHEQLLTPVGDAVFPSTLSRVTTAIGTQGTRQQALITAGQFRDPGVNGTGTQRFFSHVGGVVEYASPTDTDFTPPTILRSSGEIVNGSAGFTVITDGTARRLVVLFKSQGSNGAWQQVDLAPTPQPDGSVQWWGGAPVSSAQVEFAVEAVDASGNVALSNNKVSNFLATKLVNSGTLSVSLSAPIGVGQNNGWFGGGPVSANVTAPVGATVQYSLDASPVQPLPAAGAVPISGTGVHHLLTFDNLGDFAAADVLIDETGPSVTSAIDPNGQTTATDGSGNTWYGGPVAVTVTADDGPVGSGVASITYSSAGAFNLPSTVASDAPALVRSPLGTASTKFPVSPSGDGASVVSFSGADVAGNASAPGSVAVNIDTAPPTTSCTPPDATAWYTGDITVSCTASDAGIGLGNPADAAFTLATSAAPGAQSDSVVTSTRSVCDKLNKCVTVGPFTFKIDTSGPTITATIVPGSSVSAGSGGTTWWSGPVSLQLDASDGVGGSGVSSITYASTGALVSAGTVNAASTTAPVNPAGDGASTFTYSATDVAGNTSPAGSTTVSIDRAAPVPSCTLSDPSVWYKVDVSVTCTAADAAVGLASPADGAFTLTTSLPSGSQSATAMTGTKIVCDKLNNCVTVGPFAFEIDKLAPTATIAVPIAGATYQPGQVVYAAFTCSDGTGGSDIATTGGCVGTVANGAAIDTTVGSHTFSVTAKDTAGNTKTVTATYSVGYKVCLLYDPAYPQGGFFALKLRLCDSTGKNLSSSSITLTAVYIDAPGTSPPFNDDTPYKYNFAFGSDKYVYNVDKFDKPVQKAGFHTLYFIVNGNPATVYAAPFTLK